MLCKSRININYKKQGKKECNGNYFEKFKSCIEDFEQHRGTIGTNDVLFVEIRDLKQSVTGNDESSGKSDRNHKSVSVTCEEKGMTHARKGKVISKKKDMTHARKRKVVMDTY